MPPKPQKVPARSASKQTSRPPNTYRTIILAEFDSAKGLIPVFLPAPFAKPAASPRRRTRLEECEKFAEDAMDALAKACVGIFGGFGACMAIASAVIVIVILIDRGGPAAEGLTKMLWG